jgi:hypothetical protein
MVKKSTYKRKDKKFQAKLAVIADRKELEAKVPQKYLKAAIHGFLAGLGVIELLNCKSKTRKFVLGSAVGWHAHACFYHLVLEKKEKP